MKKLVLLLSVVVTIVSCTNSQEATSSNTSPKKTTNLEDKYPTDNPNNFRDRLGGEEDIKK